MSEAFARGVQIDLRRLQIRWMIRGDMPDVLRIEAECFDDPWTEDDFLTQLRQWGCIGMVSVISERVVGYMVYKLKQDTLDLLNLAVDPVCQRQAIGRAMIHKLQGKLSQQRRYRIETQVRERNLPGLLFFKANGFLATSVIRGHYESTDEDAIVMECFCGGCL